MVESSFSSWLAIQKENILRLMDEKTLDVAVFVFAARQLQKQYFCGWEFR